MKKILFVLPLLLLTSCNPVSNTGTDGYTFGKPQFEKNKVTITLVTYDSEKEFLEAAKKAGADYPGLAGFSTYSSDFSKNTCTIHIVSPKTKYEPEWLGHEVAHCFYGQWHTSNDHRG